MTHAVGLRFSSIFLSLFATRGLAGEGTCQQWQGLLLLLQRVFSKSWAGPGSVAVMLFLSLPVCVKLMSRDANTALIG